MRSASSGVTGSSPLVGRRPASCCAASRPARRRRARSTLARPRRRRPRAGRAGGARGDVLLTGLVRVLLRERERPAGVVGPALEQRDQAGSPRRARTMPTMPRMIRSARSPSGVDRGDPCSLSQRASVSGTIPPTMTGMSPAPASRSPARNVGDQLAVRARQDRQPTTSTSSCTPRSRSVPGKADALVDDFEADVTRTHRDLLGTVGVAVETGFADEQPQPVAEVVRVLAPPSSRTSAMAAPASRPRSPRTPRWARGRNRTRRARTPAHSPVVTPAARSRASRG